MTPQEQDLILNVARKLKDSPTKAKDSDAEKLINAEIASQADAIYKLTQAVLVQEMALKELKQKNDYLEQSAEYYRNESQRGTMSKMFGGSRPAPVPPRPVAQPSAFGSFMQTAAGVAAGMVAGHLISDMLFDHGSSAGTLAADAAADMTSSQDSNGFLDGGNNFASDYTDPGFGSDNGFGSDQGFGSGSGFGSDSGFGDDNDFSGDDMFSNNDDSNSGFFGGGDDFGDDDF